MIDQFPHCDPRVLHAPDECEYCDRHPDWQELRQWWDIAFTGHIPEDRQRSCPSDHARGLGGAHVWRGNQPMPQGIQIGDKVITTYRPIAGTDHSGH